MLHKPHQGAFEGIKYLQDTSESLYLDIGANNGQSIESIKLFKPNNPIVAFEINPPLAETLRLRYPDVTIHAVGLGRSDHTLTLFIPAYGGLFFDAWASPSGPDGPRNFLKHYVLTRRPGRIHELKCNVRTLDSFDLQPFFIKIDVEGGERSVIEGGLRTIERCRPILLVEHGHLVLDLVKPLGYDLFKFADGRFIRGEIGTPDSYLIPPHIEIAHTEG